MKKLILPFFFVLFTSIVIAQPPFFETQESELAGEFRVRINQPFYLPINNGYEFHAHVFNSSNGFPFDNATCYFHLYNSSGIEIYDLKTTITGQFDYIFNVPGTYFNTTGEYAYLVQCNTTDTGGFIASDLIVTIDGDEQPNNNIAIIFGIIGVLAFIIVIINLLDDERHTPLKLLMLFGALFVNLILASYITNLDSDLTSLYRVVLYTSVLFIAYWIFYYIYVIFMSFKTYGKKTG